MASESGCLCEGGSFTRHHEQTRHQPSGACACPWASMGKPDSGAAQDAATQPNNCCSLAAEEQSRSGPQQQQQGQGQGQGQGLQEQPHDHRHFQEPHNEQQQQQHLEQQQQQAHSQTNPRTAGPTATAPFLQDFSLVSEAAKRAQVAVVMRDLESVSL